MRINNLKNIIILTAATICFAGCTVTTNVSNNAANGNAANTANSSTPTAPAADANIAKPADNSAAKTESSGPKRISFAKGKTESVQSITLAPGASTQFILGATGAQTLFITPETGELTFRIVKGIAGELIKGDDGVYSAETKGNNAARGDIVFEVKNPTKTGISEKITIAIEDFGD